MRRLSWTLPTMVLVMTAHAATQSQPAALKPSFEVASIRPNLTGRNANVADQPGGRFVASQMPLRQLIRFAYRENQVIVGGPDWLDTERWDIQAKAPDGVVLPRVSALDITTTDTVALMVQSLLEDRFKLKSHQEIRQLPLFELTIAKRGAKIPLSEDQTPPVEFVGGGGTAGGSLPRGGVSIRNTGFEAKAQPVSMLVTVLGFVYAGQPVVDKTALKGLYDFKLEWTRDPAGPSLFTAIEEQLGLKLESAKGPLPVLVIDSVEKPSEN